jgi:hypothetical protein
MLTYTLNADGNGRIGPCVGGFIRLGICRLCLELGREIPPAALDETTDLDTLKDLNLDLLIRRAQVRRAQRDAEGARRRIEQAARERHLSPALVARVEDLRRRAEAIRTAAGYAERLVDMQRDLAEAGRLEQEACQLVAQAA